MSCPARARKRPSSRTGCARPTCSMACPGSRWRCWCGRQRPLPVLRRGLAAAGVPVAVRLDEVPLVEQPAVRPLLRLLALATGGANSTRRSRSSWSPVRSAVPTRWRCVACARSCGGHELATGGGRTSGRAARRGAGATRRARRRSHPRAVRTGRPDGVGCWPRPVRRRARPGPRPRTCCGRCGRERARRPVVRQRRRRAAPAGAAADRDLDAVVALFDAAARFVDRLPGAGPDGVPRRTCAASRSRPTPGRSARRQGEPFSSDRACRQGAGVGRRGGRRRAGGGLARPAAARRLLGSETAGRPRRRRAPTRRSRGRVARLAEERRLFYVAVTRARRTASGHRGRAPRTRSPSRFLDELDPLAAHDDRRPPDRRGCPAGSTCPSAGRRAARRVVLDPLQESSRRRGSCARSSPGLPAAVCAAPTRSVVRAESRLRRPRRCAAGRRRSGLAVQGRGVRPVRAAVAARGVRRHRRRHRASQASARWSTTSPSRRPPTTGRDVQLLAVFDQRWPTVDLGSGWVGRREHDRVRRMVERLAALARTTTRGSSWPSSAVRRRGRASPCWWAGSTASSATRRAGLLVVDLKTGSVSSPGMTTSPTTRSSRPTSSRSSRRVRRSGRGRAAVRRREPGPARRGQGRRARAGAGAAGRRRRPRLGRRLRRPDGRRDGRCGLPGRAHQLVRLLPGPPVLPGPSRRRQVTP